MSGRPRKRLVASRPPALTAPDGLEPTAIAKLLVVIAQHRVDNDGAGPSWALAAKVLGVSRREVGRVLLVLRERGFLTFSRRPGSLRLPDDSGVAAWALRVLKGRSA